MIEFLSHILVITSIFAVLAVSLDVSVGHTGLISLTHAAFYGIGAYATAVVTTEFGEGVFSGLLVACLLAAVISAGLSLAIARFQEQEFVIGTFCFQMIVSGLFINWKALTHGSLGITNIPRPHFLGLYAETNITFLTIVLVVLALIITISKMITVSPLGRVLHALREDACFVSCGGRDPERFRMTAFVVGAIMAAIAGCLYAQYVSYIDPTSFSVMESIFIISIVIIGGSGSLWGPILGAVILVAFPELLRFVGIPSAAAANIRQIIYGLALIACMLWRPQGLVGEYAFGREAKPK